MSCHDLSEEDIIKASLAQLLTEGSGSNVIESIGKEERKNWEAFKSKLIEVLGKDQEHFKHLYNTFQHAGESQAISLTKLIALFKKGRNSNDHYSKSKASSLETPSPQSEVYELCS